MKIAIILAVFVIFASGIYTANAEEPIPELIFEGGDYTVYKGNQILMPIKVQIENHDHKVHPKIHTIFENQIIDTMLLGHSSSGFYHTFLNINKNYQAGNYNLQLEYDNTKLKPIPFNIIKEFEKQKERILGFGDYSKKINEPRESFIQFSKSHVDVEFSTSTTQTISGIYDSRGMSGKILLKIDGPKSMVNNVLMTEMGVFNTEIIIDREWPTGTYKVIGIFGGTTFASSEFTIKNFNKDSLLKNEPIVGTLNLEAIKSNQFNVIIVDGHLSGTTFPNQIAMKIFHEENLIDILYNDVKDSGTFQTNLILYDHLKKSAWIQGKYKIEIVDSGTLKPYEIKSEFEITNSGNAITDLKQGMLLSSDNSESELLNFVQEIEVEKYHPKEIKVFGIIEGYLSGTPIKISILNEQGSVDEFSVFGKKSGQYDAPVFINSEWTPGQYTIYVNYRDEVQNSITFSIEGDEKTVFKSESIEEEEQTKKKLKHEKFNIIQTDSSTSQFVKLDFTTKAHDVGYNRIDVTLEKPDGDASLYKVRTALNGNFDVSLIVEDSWPEGDYLLSFVDDGEKIIFGEFSITKEKPEDEIIILSELLETANPETIYDNIDAIKITNDKFVSSNDGLYLDLSGTINEYSSGDASLTVYDKNQLFSTHRIVPKSDGTFFSPTLIDGTLSKGFHEINVIYDERIIGKSEIVVSEPITLYAEFGSNPIKISQDMFIESNNKVGVNIFGLVEGFTNTNYNSVELAILHPDSHVETIQVNTAKWGYYSHTIPVSDKWENGTYVISVKFDGEKLGHLYMQIIDFDIKWLKTHTQKWIDGEISSYQYENRINHLIQEGIIDMKQLKQDSLPDWVKMSAERWNEGDISQMEYLDVLKFIT